VYRDEAAELMAAAAGRPPPRQSVTPFPGRNAVPAIPPEARRPLPYPEPIGLNDNSDSDFAEPAPRIRRPRLSLAQFLARIAVAPLYLAVALGTLGVLVLFVMALLNSPAG
jgi:hypothetical protein